MASASKRFVWPGVLGSSRCALVAGRLAEPFLTERRQANDEVWADGRNWRVGFYFGAGDSRLWVPRRDRWGRPVDSVRVVNFAHPRGRRAFRVLVLAYGIAAVTAALFTAALLGVRW